MSNRLRLSIPLVFAALLSAAVPAAQEGWQLPAFALTAPDGRVVASSALSSEPQWLLVYVRPGCLPCERLLAAFQQWRTPALDARTVFVVGVATPGTDAALPGASALATRYIDPGQKALDALQITGAPALIGIKDGRIAWTIDGVLNDPKTVEPAVRAWVERQAPLQ